jgi:cell wall-associated NlpC family hydrolase
MTRFVLSIFLLVCTCTAFAQADTTSHKQGAVDSLLHFASSYLGTKYGYGTQSGKSFDCSGFVRHCYAKFGVDLPHGSASQIAYCNNIKLKDVQPGDLLFFSGRKISKKNIGHVSMVKAVEGDRILMIHATVQSGVIQEYYPDSEYFRKRFIAAGRLKKGLQ